MKTFIATVSYGSLGRVPSLMGGLFLSGCFTNLACDLFFRLALSGDAKTVGGDDECISLWARRRACRGRGG